MKSYRKNRWFRFSLRTMVVIVTVICCWLGWQMRIVRERQATIARLQGNHAYRFTTATVWAQRFPAGTPVPKLARIPTWRVLFGDEAIQEIWTYPYMESASSVDGTSLARLFPEAEMLEVHPEPCHPGCFPRDTLVQTPIGERPIHSIMVGDAVSTLRSNGDVDLARVQTVFVTMNQIWKIETDQGILYTTQTQPLWTSMTESITAGKLQVGQQILRFEDGQTVLAKVLSISSTERMEKVFNLILNQSERFVANGFLARSKPPAEGIDPAQVPPASFANVH